MIRITTIPTTNNGIKTMKLLSKNAKTEKSLKLNVLTFALQLAPSDLSGHNVCPKASNGCRLTCLYYAGKGAFSNVQKARINRTLQFFDNREQFMLDLVQDVQSGIKKAKKLGFIPSFRLNTLSDLPFEKFRVTVNGIEYRNIMDAFPDIQFYDYTAIPNRKVPSNYHLTFSRKEDNQADVERAIENGYNVSVVFKKTLPETYMGLPVIDGDQTDVRYLDPKGVIVGLKAKGKARKDTSGFVVIL